MTKSVSATTVSASAVNRATYLKHLLTQASAAADESPLRKAPLKASLKALRDEAIAAVSDRTFPSGRDEEWRFTDLSDMLTQPFQRPSQDGAHQRATSVQPTLVDSAYQLNSVNGFFEGADATSINWLDGAIVAPLSELMDMPEYAQKLEPIIAQKLAKIEGADEIFTAINTAGFSDVMVVWVAADQVVKEPICINRESQGSAIAHLRTLVVAERYANLTLGESFVGTPEATRCNTSVTELWLAEGAQVNHIRIQDESAQTFHIAKTAVDQAANSQYKCTAIDLGAKLSRHHLEVFQSGPQTDTHMYGLSALGDRQLADAHSLLTMTYPHGTATQIQKNIVDDRAHAVFNGRVFVSQAAQHTDASQLNRNLMLSSKARIDTKPELDIVADDVKCAHGATVSQLQADEVFYLQSRGINAEQAQRLLLYGFAMEIVEKISLAPLRDALSERLTAWAK